MMLKPNGEGDRLANQRRKEIPSKQCEQSIHNDWQDQTLAEILCDVYEDALDLKGESARNGRKSG